MSWSLVLGNFRPYSSRVVAMAVAVIHGWYCFSCTVATGRAVPCQTESCVATKSSSNATSIKNN